jgi:hypothetical protein
VTVSGAGGAGSGVAAAMGAVAIVSGAELAGDGGAGAGVWGTAGPTSTDEPDPLCAARGLSRLAFRIHSDPAALGIGAAVLRSGERTERVRAGLDAGAAGTAGPATARDTAAVMPLVAAPSAADAACL